MPTNLNALIRYKQIDSCLKNNRYGCSIFDLIEACSDALAEFRGTNRRISERTIRDDLRVMRSEILGFNAPIEFHDGKYVYAEKDFTLFNTPIKELDILKEVFELLKKRRKELEDLAVESILQRIGKILGEDVPAEEPIINEEPEKIHKSIEVEQDDLIKEVFGRVFGAMALSDSNESDSELHKGDSKYLSYDTSMDFMQSDDIPSENEWRLVAEESDSNTILWKEIFELIA